MKHKTLLRFPILLLAGLLVGCGDVNSVSDDARAQQAKDSKTLEDLYSNVEGVWEGTVVNQADGFKAFKSELAIYTYYVQDGVNSDGSPRLRPTLRGRFRPSDFVTETDNVILVGDYDRSGRVVMTAQAPAGGASGAPPLVLSLRGLMTGGTLSLEISRQGGVWGFFEAKRTKTFASAPQAGELADDRERFQRIFGRYEGVYEGPLKSVDGNDYMVRVSLSLTETETEPGQLVPLLTALYERLGDFEGSGFDTRMSVDFKVQTGDITMRSLPGEKLGAMSLIGTLLTEKGKTVFRSTVRDRRGVIGNFEATRK